MSELLPAQWRKTTQPLAPSDHHPTGRGQYDIYPAFPCQPGAIKAGAIAFAQSIAGHPVVIIDGEVGTFWEHLRSELDQALQSMGIQADWLDVRDAMQSERQIDQMIEPFLGGDDPIFGTRFTGSLKDFFDKDRIARLKPRDSAPLTVLYGCGAALAEWEGILVFVDLPKNEVQFRARAGSVCNLGASQSDHPKPMYKRFYFVDWVAMRLHKEKLLSRVDLFVDAQRPEEMTLISGDDLRDALQQMSQNFFRVRPWFEPGPWGGNWMKERFSQLEPEVPNYAWSFELIVPENGLLLSSDQLQLEVSFDWLMVYNHRAILGQCADRFGLEFPIRFDYLDTVDGGNLSLQCHPRPDYIRQHFGETFTQDETYYIFDCKPGARVYLGFQEGVDPKEFRDALEHSLDTASELDVHRYIHTEVATKHDLFLIPHGTIHCSGQGNLVLEISATPYIFTFKMYDWLRLDLDGKPRPINIDRAMENLYFKRSGDRVRQELISKPSVLDRGEDWQLVHLPTHADHFYDVHRLEFDTQVTSKTAGSCHVLNLVEGDSILLETEAGMKQRFHYAETFVIPAAASSYTLTNEGKERAKVVKAFVKQTKESK